MLGTMAGLWITIIVITIVGFSILTAVVASFATSKESVDFSKKTVLYLDLDGVMQERRQPAGVWQVVQERENGGETLVNTLDAIYKAAYDSKIEGIYINAGSGSCGIAAREEIISALQKFKETGKWIMAYADSYSQGNYILASVADNMYLNPSGSVDVRGVASQVPFMKGLLDKLGVKMQIVRVGTFKSAVEPYMNSEMSPASRLQTQAMIDTIWDYSVDVVAENRGVEAVKVNDWADSIMGTWSAERILNAEAVTELAYRREVEDSIRERCNLAHEDELPLISPSDYLSHKNDAFMAKGDSHVAVLFAVGDIVDSGDGGIVGETMVPEILELADDDNVKALVLRVNSGGGSAFASEQIWEALEYFKSKGKPFYVSMGDYAASGGYYISCGADKIYADRTTLTGSIGVFGVIPDFSGLVTDKLGVTFSTVQTNRNAAFLSTVASMTPEQAAAMQNSVDLIYEQFTSRVAEGRGMSQDSVKAIAEGRVWVGGKAVEIGLVDQIGGLHAAIRDIARDCDLDEDDVVYYPDVTEEMMVEFIRSAMKDVSIDGVSIDANTLRMMKYVDNLQKMAPIQARMSPIEIY